MENFYKNKWQKLLKEDYFPSYLNNLQSFEFSVFEKIINSNNEKSERLLNEVFNGDSLIINYRVEKHIG